MIIDMRAEAAATDDALGRYELEPTTPESMGGHGDYHGDIIDTKSGHGGGA